MHISVKWFDKQFNVSLSSKEGAEEFLTIKGCRIVQGKDGEFVSMPSTKNEATGKYWNHAWASDKFQAAVLALAKASRPGTGGPPQSKSDEDDIPW